jgi:hypothetical protein
LVFLSDFARAEFASAMARRVRTGEIAIADAKKAFGVLDAWPLGRRGISKPLLSI